MTTASYCLRPFLHSVLLLMTFAMMMYPFYIVYFVGYTVQDGKSCFTYYGTWGLCELSHMLLWTAIFALVVMLYPLRLERDDERVEFRLVLVAMSVPCPYDQIKSVTAASCCLPGYVRVTTSMGALIVNPSVGVQAFIEDYEEARRVTSSRYGATGPAFAAAPMTTFLRRLSQASGSHGQSADPNTMIVYSPFKGIAVSIAGSPETADGADDMVATTGGPSFQDERAMEERTVDERAIAMQHLLEQREAAAQMTRDRRRRAAQTEAEISV